MAYIPETEVSRATGQVNSSSQEVTTWPNSNQWPDLDSNSTFSILPPFYYYLLPYQGHVVLLPLDNNTQAAFAHLLPSHPVPLLLQNRVQYSTDGLNLNPLDVENFMNELQNYHEIYSPLFARREQRQHYATYLSGLLSKIDNKSVEGIVIELIGPDSNAIRSMQHFISKGAWDDEAILKQHWKEVEKKMGEDEGVFIVDGSGFPKKGNDSAGVQWQYCGQLGKRANCQVGVFTGYATFSSSSYCLLDRRLYLPEKWFGQDFAQKRQKCGIPEDITFKTKPQLAADMLAAIQADGNLSGHWVAADEAFGRDTSFLDQVDDLNLWYLAEVPTNTNVWLERPQTHVPPWSGKGRKPTKVQVVKGQPKALTVLEVADLISSEEWTSYTIKEGTKGPIVADFAFRRVIGVRDSLPGKEVWLVLRRSGDEIKTFLCNAPKNIELARMVRVSGLRWPIETCFLEGKQLLGMGDYQVRSWLGWYHHMTLVILAHFFFTSLRIFIKDQQILTMPQLQLLLFAVLPRPIFNVQRALEIVAYRVRRNRAAYLSHRKRRLAQLAT